MGATLSIVFPIFGLVALGYVVVRSGYLSQTAADGLNAFVLSIAMPVLLFRTLSTADPSLASPVLLWLVYFPVVLVVFAAGFLVARRVARLDNRTSVVAGVSTAYGNLVLVSLPVIERVYGRAGLDVLAMLIAVHLPIMVIGSMLLIEWGVARDRRSEGAQSVGSTYGRTLGRVGRTLLRHPLFIAALLGAGFRAFSLAPPLWLAEMIDALAGTAGPLALVALGMSLPRYRVASEMQLPMMLGALALFAQPALVYLVGLPILPPLWLGVATLAAAAPSGVNAYLLAVHFKAGEKIAATMAVATTAASLLSLTFWVLILSA